LVGPAGLQLGDYLVFGVEPGAQIQQLTALGTEREEPGGFGLFSR